MSLLKKFIPGNDINNTLYKAIYVRDLEKVNTILDSVGVAHCESWRHGNDLLVTALECKHLDVAKVLVNKGCHLDCRSSQSQSVIHLAVKLGNEEFVTTLLDRNRRLSLKPEILHLAIAEGHIKIVKVLLTRGADIESRTGGGTTPLHVATLRGNLEILEELVTTGANLESEDFSGKTSLFLAVSSGNLPLVTRLLELGANCKCKSKTGQTPLLDASNKGYIEIVRILIAFGADLSDKNRFGQTPLHIACMQNNKNLISTLLDAGADVNAVDNNQMVPCDAIVKKESQTQSMYFENISVAYVMGKHLIKLHIGGFYLNKKNLTFHDVFYKMYCNEILAGNVVVSTSSDALHSMVQTCKEQVLLMKSTKSRNNFTVFDVLEKLKNPLSVVSKSEITFLQSVNMHDKFSLYEGTITNLMKSAELRNHLLSSCDEWLSFVFGISTNRLPPLPEEVRTQVLSALSNKELELFIQSAKNCTAPQ